MNKIILSLLSCTVLVGCQTNSPSVVSAVSDSGLEYSLIQMPGNNRVSFQIAWDNHWIESSENNQATPPIGAQLILAGGAKGHLAGDVVEAFADMQSEGFLSVGPDHLYGTLHYSPEFTDDTLTAANAHLLNPLMEQKWLDRIREQFLAGVNEAKFKPISQVFEAMRWAILGDQVVRAALSLDEPGMIEAVTQDDVLRWSNEIINRNNASIVIAGDLSELEAGDAVDTLFKGITDGAESKPAAFEADFSPKRMLLHVPKAETSTMSFLAKLPPIADGDSFEDYLAVEGLRQKLLEAVREELRASYTFSVGIDAFSQEHRFLVMTGEVETEKVAKAETVLLEAYEQYRESGFSGNLDVVKKPLFKNLDNTMGDTGSMAYTVLSSVLSGQDIGQVLLLEKELKAVTANSLKERLQTAFPSADEFLLVVSSPDDSVLNDACVIVSPKQASDC